MPNVIYTETSEVSSGKAEQPLDELTAKIAQLDETYEQLDLSAVCVSGRQPYANIDGNHENETLPAQNKGPDMIGNWIERDGEHAYQTSGMKLFQV